MIATVDLSVLAGAFFRRRIPIFPSIARENGDGELTSDSKE
jgi:hypothetical protein